MKKTLLVIIIFLLSCEILTGCINNENTSTEKNEYSWSTMNEGPYNDKISYATSNDLLNWIDSETILAEHASVPGAIYKNNTIYVYFVDVSVDGIPERIALIRSNDNGQTWSEKEFINIQGIDDRVPVDPAPLLLNDGRIRLYYFDINEERSSTNPERKNKIYSAISSDGINFVQENGIRFSEKNIYDPDVILVNNTYRMYVGEIPNNRVISATSSDGLNFIEGGVAYNDGAVPDVFFKNNTYYLYTAGIDISTSADGTSFTKTSYRFESELGMLTADPSVIELNNGEYMMFYKTK